MEEITELLEDIRDTLQKLYSRAEETAEALKTIEVALTEYGVDIYGEYDN